MENPKPGIVKKFNRNPVILLAFAIPMAAYLIGCSRHQASAFHPTPEDSISIVREILAHRAEADKFFRTDPASPFVRDTAIRYTGIKWFPPDLRYCFNSPLFRYDRPAQTTIYGTKGEPRPSLRYGYFVISFEGKEYRLDVYKPAKDPSDPHLSIWFTDQTSGHETYHVGRYVDIGNENPDARYVYFIDLNDAYNPYCAYSALYSCAVPTKDDHLDFPVRAGEMNYSE
ncbi:MAG TPA: DUF1684 domain-containing protein [Bacteroidota bacterium]|nr:DUF1684 domain-containing protein [Bacteroidota bacterium]